MPRAAITACHQIGSLDKEVDFLFSLETSQNQGIIRFGFLQGLWGGVYSGHSPSFQQFGIHLGHRGGCACPTLASVFISTQDSLRVSITKFVLFLHNRTNWVRTCPNTANFHPNASRRLYGQLKPFSKVLKFKFHHKSCLGSNAAHGVDILVHILQPRVVSPEFGSASKSAWPLR